jgi:membrane-bound ClpP family serine protease
MLIFGLLLVAVAAAAAIGALFLLDGDVEYFGIDTDPLTVFLAGAAALGLLLLGLKLTGFGARRGLRQRKEHRRLAELSDRLESAEKGREDDKA